MNAIARSDANAAAGRRNVLVDRVCYQGQQRRRRLYRSRWWMVMMVVGAFLNAPTITTRRWRKIQGVVKAQQPQLSQPMNMALALGGGGFLSLADFTGITAGLLSVLCTTTSKQQQLNCTLANTNLFHNIDTMTSISGGSWFASKLLYSPSFLTLIEQVAAASSSEIELGINEKTHENNASTKNTTSKYQRQRQSKHLHNRISHLYNHQVMKSFIELETKVSELMLVEQQQQTGTNTKKNHTTTSIANEEEFVEQNQFLNEALLSLKVLRDLNNNNNRNQNQTNTTKDFDFNNITSWFDVINQFILSDIPSDTTLGGGAGGCGDSDNNNNSDVATAEWAKGKQWSVIVSVVTPSTKQEEEEDDSTSPTTRVIIDSDITNATKSFFSHNKEMHKASHTYHKPTNRLSYTTTFSVTQTSTSTEPQEEVSTSTNETSSNRGEYYYNRGPRIRKQRNLRSTSSTPSDSKYDYSLYRPARFSAIVGGRSLFEQEPSTRTTLLPYSHDPSLRSLKLDYVGRPNKNHPPCRQDNIFLCTLLYGDTNNDELVLHESSTKDLIPQETSSTSSNIFQSSSFHQNFQNTPLVEAVAASSAYFGPFLMNDWTAYMFQEILQFDPSVWFSSTLSETQAFDIPRDMVQSLWQNTNNQISHQLLQTFATKKIHQLTDGGWTDPHGVATAVASGATDIFVMVGSYHSHSIEYYFSNLPSTNHHHKDSSSSSMFNQILSSSNNVITRDEIFQQDYTVALNALANAPHIHLPKEVKFLTKLVYVSNLQVTTKECQRYGIHQLNQPITLHVLQPESTLGITAGLSGLDSSKSEKNAAAAKKKTHFANYGALVADIVLTLQDPRNSDIVNDILSVFMRQS